MSGWQAQKTGDLGQAIVTAELTQAGFLVGTLSPDPGEDLWAELDGRAASASGDFPLRALFQVKATAEPVQECVIDAGVDQLRRWAAQPVPVFLVGVTTSERRFFCKSIDDIVAEDLGGADVYEITTKTKRVRISQTADLDLFVRRAIETHYHSIRLRLAGIAESAIAADYFEVLSEESPERWAPIPIVGWSVLWKSAPRPQHFAAMIEELIFRATKRRDSMDAEPAWFVFHIYRSIADRHNNLAVARVDFLNPLHPRHLQLRQQLGIQHKYRVRRDRDIDVYRDISRSKTASAADFRGYAFKVGIALDAVAEKLLAKRSAGVAAWDESLQRDFSAVDSLWDDGPYAPAECNAIETILERYYGHFLTHRRVELRRSKELPVETVRRLLRKTEAEIAGLKGAWRIVVNIKS